MDEETGPRDPREEAHATKIKRRKRAFQIAKETWNPILTYPMTGSIFVRF
jgi:hypothetical protein